MLALAAMVMLFRPDKKADAKEERLQDAQWVMLQDKKKLEACVESRESFRREARAQLDSVGLEEAQGSLRRARTLLDEAKDARAESNLYRQRQQALVSRRSSLEESLALASASACSSASIRVLSEPWKRLTRLWLKRCSSAAACWKQASI